LTELVEDEGDLRPVRRFRDWIRADGSIWKRLIRIAVVLLLLPYFVIFLYWPPFVHPVSTLMVGDLLTFQGYERRWVPLDEIAPVLVQSVMMSEDGQFCSHYGIDTVQMKDAIDEALAGKSSRGASTITMQTAKNLYLWNSHSLVRKVLELPLALSIDFVWSKYRIMEVYLNIAEWGPGIYGIEAAARYYFKTSAAKLNVRQAALLAAALPNPYKRIPSKPTRGMRGVAGLIAHRAAASGDYVKCIYP
jgi:monofunctional glycosyltransferase